MMNILTINICHSKKVCLSQGEHKTDWKAMLRFAISDPVPREANHLDLSGSTAIQYFHFYTLNPYKPLCSIPILIYLFSVYHQS